MMMRPQFLFLLLLLPLILLHPPPTSGIEEAFCASLRLVHYRTLLGTTQVVGPWSIGGPMSMGDEFWYDKEFNSFWAANHVRKSFAQNNRQDLPRLDIYAVKGERADGSLGVLPGWLHLKLTRKDASKLIPILAVWARTLESESIGTFVDVDSKCGPANVDKWDSYSDARWLPPASAVPCAGTPVFSPMNPNMAVYVAKGGTLLERKEVHLLWKLDMTVCDNIRDVGFQFLVAIPPEEYTTQDRRLDVGKTHGRVIPNPNADPNDPSTKDFKFPEIGPYVFVTGTIKVNFYGATAPIFDPTSLFCGGTDHDITDQTITQKANWLKVPLDAGLPGLGALTHAPDIFIGDKQASAGKDPYDDSKHAFLRWRCGPVGSTGCPDSSNKPWPRQYFEVVHRRQTCKPEPDYSRGGGKPPKEEYKGFWGRCGEEVKMGNQPGSSRYIHPDQSSPKCPYGKTGTEVAGWTYHYKYIDTNRHGQLKQKGCTCPSIPTGDEVKAANQRFKIEHARPYHVEGGGCKQVKSMQELDRLGLCKDSVAGKNAASVRMWHACTMLFTVLVSNSISSYMARYLKGSITVVPLTGQYRIPLATWYIVHIALVLPTLCMYVTCLSSMSKQTDILGYSLDTNAINHRGFGWTIIGAFFFQVVSGFLRPLNIRGRRIAIWIHWGCGEFVYHGAAILCIMTYKIPASPFSYVRHLDSHFGNIFYHAAPTIMLLWLAWDLLFHGYTTAYIIWFDRRHDARLGVSACFPILVPRVSTARYRGRGDRDLIKRGKNLRRLAWGYGIFCALTYGMLVCVLHFWPNLDYHGFGLMQCTHSPDGKFDLGSAKHSDIIQQKKFCPDL